MHLHCFSTYISSYVIHNHMSKSYEEKLRLLVENNYNECTDQIGNQLGNIHVTSILSINKVQMNLNILIQFSINKYNSVQLKNNI